jgi:hypothetical protein
MGTWIHRSLYKGREVSRIFKAARLSAITLRDISFDSSIPWLSSTGHLEAHALDFVEMLSKFSGKR